MNTKTERNVTAVRMGKTKRERINGVKDRQRKNKEAAAAYHRDSKAERPTHFNGKKQFQRRVTGKGNQTVIVDRVGKHLV